MLDIKKKLLLYSLLLVIANSALLYLGWFSPLKKIWDVNNDIKMQEAHASSLHNNGFNNIEALKNLKKGETSIKQLNKIFMSESQKVEIITNLEQIAKKNKVDQKVEFGDAQIIKDADYKKAQLKINATGKYSNIIKYLRELESQNYYLNSQDLQLSLDSDGSNVDLNLSGETYWR